MFVQSNFQFAYLLGREPLLSAAEIWARKPEHASIVAVSFSAMILEGISPEEAMHLFAQLGGSVRLVQVAGTIASTTEWPAQIRDDLEALGEHSKLSFALASNGISLPLQKTALSIKKRLEGSYRVANTSDQNVNAATFKKNRLDTDGREYVLIQIRGALYHGRTVACQDVDTWKERDTLRIRDAKVGMLPTKLARMMINLTEGSEGIYDPFVGLGTVLTEAQELGISPLVGSDMSADMVDASQKNVPSAKRVFVLDARDIDTAKDLKAEGGLRVVTEGYLGTPMHPGNISDRSIERARGEMRELYELFLTSLARAGIAREVVLSAPVWHFKDETFDISLEAIARRSGWRIAPLLDRESSPDRVPRSTLLYRRADQIVGRQIARLVR